MPKDVPIGGWFQISQTSKKTGSARFKKHHFQLPWEDRFLVYNQRFGRGAFREKIDLSKAFGVSLVDDPRKSGGEQLIELTLRDGIRFIYYTIKPAKDFNNFLYWLLVSLVKHSNVNPTGKVSRGLKQSRKKKLESRQGMSDFEQTHNMFMNAVSLFEQRKAKAGGAKAAKMFGRREPVKVEISLDGGESTMKPREGIIEGEDGVVIRELGKKLGTGQIGLVYLAERMVKDLVRIKGRITNKSEPCVVKLVKTTDSTSDMTSGAKETINEGRILAAIGKHENIIQVIDARVAEGSTILILEKGICDLASKIEPDGEKTKLAAKTKLEPEEIRRFVRGILAGLSHMHERKIYHLDIKPENIILFVDDTTKLEFPKLIDFGKSKSKAVNGSDIYGEKWFMYGTKRYIAPESYDPKPTKGVHLEKRDSYAAGIMFLRMLIGPKYGWEYNGPNRQLETKTDIEARINFWKTKVMNPANLKKLELDQLHDIAMMAVAMINKNRDQRVSAQDAFKVFEVAESKQT